jgi:hypothetical protein
MAYSEQMWQDAKKKCRLNNEDIELAKRLGLNPRSLVKNIPNKSEPWKAPISVWLNCTPIVRQYDILITIGVFFYAKRSTKQAIYARI